MACNCGNKNQNKVYDFVSKTGETKQYPSEIQARAAVIRAGGGKVVARAV